MKGRVNVMKKKIFLILAAALISMQSAYAYDIQVDINAFNFDVSLRSDETTERPALQLLNEERTKVLYMAEGISIPDDENYTYLFNFDTFGVPKSLPTGKYILRVGGMGIETKETTISFVNNLDKSDALNELNSSSNKGEVLINRASGLGIDTESFLGLSAEWQKTVTADLSAADFSNDGSDEQINEKYDLFIKVYGKSMEKAVIAGSDDSDAVYSMIEKSSQLELDKDGFYPKLSSKNAVAKILAGRSYKTDITEEEVKKEFDGAVLAAVINQLDWGSAKAAAEYYAGTGIISLSFTDFNRLSYTNQSNVFKELKAIGITAYENIPAEFNRLVNKYTTQANNSSSSGGGGGGGGSTGGFAATAPAPPQSSNGAALASDAAKPETEENLQDFLDMEGFEWAYEAVMSLKKQGVVDGDGTGCFNPDKYVTREEFAKIVVLAFELYSSNAKLDFDDVAQDAWYAPYVASAKSGGIIIGINEAEFGTGRAIIRQDMAVMLKRIYDMADITKSGEAVSFSDYDEISGYAQDAVDVLSRAGVLNGDDKGKFMPYGNVTRAQSAKAVYELLKVIKGE